MKKILLVLAGVISFGFGSQSFAGLYLEPNINFIVSGDSKDNTAGGTDGKVTGSHYGLRAGMSFVNLAFGVDYALGKIKDKDDVTSETTDYDTTELGAFARVGLPMFQVYGAYIFDSKADVTVNSVDIEVKGSGFKFGVGYTGLPFVAINLEYKTTNFDEMNIPGQEIDSDITEISLGVSLPLSL